MGKFNLDDYAPVEERLAIFHEQHPSGRVLTEVVRLEPPLCVFRAEVYRDGDDLRPWATGYAYEIEGEGHVNRTSYVENCETSAIGRALANAGYHGRRDGAPRPSREEMQKVRRMSPADEGAEAARRDARGASDPGCPACGGPMWDNRAKKDAGDFNPKSPDYACKDKQGCGAAIWLSSMRDDLLRELAVAYEAQQIDTVQRDEAEAIAKSGDLGRMLRLRERMHELVLQGDLL